MEWNKKKLILVSGAGLAACEIAYQLAKRGLKVKLYEAKTLDFLHNLLE